MSDNSVINKIAEGLFDNAKENNLIKVFQQDLNFLVYLLKTNDRYFSFLTSPFVDIKEKEESLYEVFKGLLLKETLKFISILIEKNLIKDIEEIKEAYDDLADKEIHILKGIIYSPFEIDEKTIHKLEASFKKYLKQNVKLSVIIDTSLICGIKVLIIGTMYEYSLNSKLEDLKENILNERLKSLNLVENEE